MSGRGEGNLQGPERWRGNMLAVANDIPRRLCLKDLAFRKRTKSSVSPSSETSPWKNSTEMPFS